MKQTNRILALLVALVLAFTLALPAFAEGVEQEPPDRTIWETIKDTLYELFVLPLMISAILPALLSIMIPPFIVFFPFIFIVIFIPVFLINIIF